MQLELASRPMAAIRQSAPATGRIAYGQAALLAIGLMAELLLFIGIYGLVEDLLVSFVATVAASLMILPLLLNHRDR